MSVSASIPESISAKTQRSASAIDRIFTADAIGENVAYLERITGPAFSTFRPSPSYRISERENIYKVNGCEVIAGTSEGIVDNLGIENYSSKCSFNIGQYFGRRNGRPESLRLPTLSYLAIKFGGTFFPECLGSSCGNSHEPQIFVFYAGVHVDNFNQLVASADIMSGDKSGVWSQALSKKYGTDYLGIPNRSKDNLNDLASKVYQGVYPTTVRVGIKLFGGDETPLDSCRFC